ncbi:MAG: hypothetical protein PHV02_16100, partial [Rhodocyclaceae bacterium]|nr:hypothetical protein [Rhodocyclaceae bacterium]
RRRIQGWANTGRHFLRIGFSITPILSNTYRVIRPICARSGLASRLKARIVRQINALPICCSAMTGTLAVTFL